MNHLIAIVGPTGIGKSSLAIRLAQALEGEIVSADSRQVYCYMDIGTAKPSKDELGLVPHHLISLIRPNDGFSLAQYQRLAVDTIGDIQRRDKLPLLVGGSGLYVWAVLEGWGIPQVPPDQELRNNLEARAAEVGNYELHKELGMVDEEAAQRIDPRNLRRVIRALEVRQRSNNQTSQIEIKKAVSPDTLIIGLTTDRDELYRRIDLRVDEMIENNLVGEVQKLVDMGYHFNTPALSGIGYKQIGMYLRGEINLDTAAQQIKFETHRFVRQQYNWFQLKDSRIKWFDIQKSTSREIAAAVAEFVTQVEESRTGS